MQAYSLDFRRKIIEIYETEKISVRKLAKRFGIAPSSVQNLIKRYRQTGSVAPKPHGGGAPSKLDASQLLILEELVEKNNDATLAELCDLLENAVGVKLSVASMGRKLQQRDYTFKKNTSSHGKRIR